MAGSVLTITKGAMFQAADAVLATPPAGKTLAQWYQQLRQDLLTGRDSLAALASGVGAINGAADVAHVNDEALGDGTNAFWPRVPDKEQILREGFIAAYDLALSTQPTRPITTFWKVVRNRDVFEVVLTASPQQITLFWVTTEPRGWGRCKGLVDEEMWLVASEPRTREVRSRYADPTKLVPRGAGAAEVPPRSTGVQILKLRGD